MAVDIGLEEGTREAIPIDFVDAGDWEAYAARSPERTRAFARACGFEAKPGQSLLAPGENGALERVLFGVEAQGAHSRDPFLAGKLATLLPPGVYRFDRRRPRTRKRRRWPSFCRAIAFPVMSRQRPSARGFARPPASTPPASRGSSAPSRWGAISSTRRPMTWGRTRSLSAALELAERHGATSRVIVGEALLAENFPLIHAVGRASAQAPRLVDFVHGPEDALKVTLVGKGVCFDTGGLDIKPSSAMLLMKKDMGGAAVALSLASMLLEGGVPVRLRVILPIVENSMSASAYRPGDIYRSRKGLYRRDRQHRRGRAARAGRRAGAGLRGRAGPVVRLRDADRRRARRARPGIAALLHRRRRARARHCEACRGRGRSRVAHAAVGQLRQRPRRQDFRCRQCHQQSAWPARSRRRCFCAASSPTPSAGRISTSIAGTPRRNPAAPKAATSRPRGCFTI